MCIRTGRCRRRAGAVKPGALYISNIAWRDVTWRSAIWHVRYDAMRYGMARCDMEWHYEIWYDMT